MTIGKTNYDQSGFDSLIHQTTLTTAQKAANLSLKVDQLFQEPAAPYHAVHATTTIENENSKLRFTMYANEKVLRHIADSMLGEPADDPEDYEDAVKEFFNIICGRIVSEMVKKYHIRIVFPPPVFSSAYEAPTNSIAHMSFSDGCGERLCIVCD